MEAAWCKALARIEGRSKCGSKETEVMHSALSECIISLRLVNVVPRSIHDWIDKEDGGRSVNRHSEPKCGQAGTDGRVTMQI